MVLDEFKQHFFEMTEGKWAELEGLVQRYESRLGAERVQQIRSEVAGRRRRINLEIQRLSASHNLLNQHQNPNDDGPSNSAAAAGGVGDKPTVGTGGVTPAKPALLQHTAAPEVRANQQSASKTVSTDELPQQPATPKKLKETNMFAVYDSLPALPPPSKRQPSKSSTTKSPTSANDALLLPQQQPTTPKKLKETNMFAVYDSRSPKRQPSKSKSSTKSPTSASPSSREMIRTGSKSYFIGTVANLSPFTTQTKEKLKAHHRMPIQNKELPFKCKCGYEGKVAEALKDHLRFRIYQSIFKCPSRNCWATYGNNDIGFKLFKGHCWRHHQLKVVTGCQMCGLGFGSFDAMEEHTKTECRLRGALELAMGVEEEEEEEDEVEIVEAPPPTPVKEKELIWIHSDSE